jgi:hypothetical protein
METGENLEGVMPFSLFFCKFAGKSGMAISVWGITTNFLSCLQKWKGFGFFMMIDLFTFSDSLEDPVSDLQSEKARAKSVHGPDP